MCRHSTADLNSRCRDVRADAAGLEEAVLLTLKKQLEVLLPVHEDGTIHLEDTAAKCSEYEKQMEALKDQNWFGLAFSIPAAASNSEAVPCQFPTLSMYFAAFHK